MLSSFMESSRCSETDSPALHWTDNDLQCRYDSCCVNLVQIEPPLRRRDDVEVASTVEKFRIGAASARRDVFRVEIKPLLRPVPLLEVLNVPILKQPLTCAVIRPGSISSAEITSYNRTSGPE
jgi:hypothetical protein